MNPFKRIFGKGRKEPEEAVPAVTLDPQQTIKQIENGSRLTIDTSPTDIGALTPPKAEDPPRLRSHTEKAERKLLGAASNPWAGHALTQHIGDLGNTVVYAGISAITMGPEYYHALHKHKEIVKALDGLERKAEDVPLTPTDAYGVITLTTKLGAGARQKDVLAATSALVQLEAAQLASKHYLIGEEAKPGEEARQLERINANHARDDQFASRTDLVQALDGIKAPTAPSITVSPVPLTPSTKAKETLGSAVTFGMEVALPRHALFTGHAATEAAKNSQEIPVNLKKPSHALVNAQAHYDNWNLTPKGDTPIKAGDLPAEAQTALQNDYLLHAGEQWQHMGDGGTHKVLSGGEKQKAIADIRARESRIEENSRHLADMEEHVKTLQTIVNPPASRLPNRGEDYSDRNGPLPLDTPAIKDPIASKNRKAP